MKIVREEVVARVNSLGCNSIEVKLGSDGFYRFYGVNEVREHICSHCDHLLVNQRTGALLVLNANVDVARS